MFIFSDYFSDTASTVLFTGADSASTIVGDTSGPSNVAGSLDSLSLASLEGLATGLVSKLAMQDAAGALWKLVFQEVRNQGCPFWWFEVVCHEKYGPGGYEIRSPDPLSMKSLKFLNKQQVVDVFSSIAARYHFKLTWISLE